MDFAQMGEQFCVGEFLFNHAESILKTTGFWKKKRGGEKKKPYLRWRFLPVRAILIRLCFIEEYMRLYVGNLSYTTNEDTLREAFSNYGDVISVQVMRDRFTEQSKGFAFIEMGTDLQSERAIGGMNGKAVDGRRLRVSEAVDKPPRRENSERGERRERFDRGERFERGERSGRFDRGERRDRFSRGERRERGDFHRRESSADEY